MNDAANKDEAKQPEEEEIVQQNGDAKDVVMDNHIRDEREVIDNDANDNKKEEVLDDQDDEAMFVDENNDNNHPMETS